MKNALFVLFMSLSVTQFVNATEAVTSQELVTKILTVMENVKDLHSSCVLSLSSSTSTDEYVAVTLKDASTGRSATLTLNTSWGQIAKSVSGTSGVTTQTFKTSKGNLSLSRYEDLADTDVTIQVGSDNVSCHFSE